ncbi:juvenile hormone acid O-methyltransferase-like [Haemaphysalis longicornis]
MTSSSTVNNPRYNSRLYAESNSWQRALNLKAIDLLQMAFSPKATKRLQFLDLGCGTGDFTRDFLLPRCLPCRRIVAVDSSEDMLSYARQNSAHTNIEFDFLNISEDVGNFVQKYGAFDRVYSFFCLNWVSDQREAMKNVSRLLAPSGECLLLFPAWSPTKMFWRKLAQMDRWNKFYEVTFEGYTPTSQDLDNDKERLSYLGDLVNGAGLVARTCEMLYVQHDYDDLDEFIDMQVSLNPAASLLEPADQKCLRSDIAREVRLPRDSAPMSDPSSARDDHFPRKIPEMSTPVASAKARTQQLHPGRSRSTGRSLVLEQATRTERGRHALSEGPQQERWQELFLWNVAQPVVP